MIIGRWNVMLSAAAAILWTAAVGRAIEPVGFDKAVEPFLKTYCLRCHNDKKREGEFRLDTLSRDFADAGAAKRWDEVIFRLNSGEMPPEGEPQPSSAELGKVVDWL